jgi:prepilin-type N-terminal cleavage/methylation domain-containing protein
MKTQRKKSGFTLMETMIVVMIIGLALAIGIPYGLRSALRTRTQLVAQELRVTASMFTIHNMEKGHYPASASPGVVPEGMLPYLKGYPWTKKNALGGFWKWSLDEHGVKAAIAIIAPKWGDSSFLQVDEAIDDGNLSTGFFRVIADRAEYIFIIEE